MLNDSVFASDKVFTLPDLEIEAIAVDFLNSGITASGAPKERLGNGEDLLSWLKGYGLICGNVASRLRSGTLPGELDIVTAQARDLRAWFRKILTDLVGRPPSPEDLEVLAPIVDLLGRDELYLYIGPQNYAESEIGKPTLQLTRRRRWRTPDSLLLPLAEVMARLITSEAFARLRLSQEQYGLVYELAPA